MSTFIGKVSGKPFMHMTSDVKTEAAMQGAPSPTTLFHSDLPYVFAREQWELTSYTEWNGSNGGRKFALPADAQTFRQNNPNLAYIVIVENGAGEQTIINPCLVTQCSYLIGSYSGNRIMASATVGIDYSVAFTDSDTQLENLTRNTRDYLGGTLSITFRLWDANDTSLTIFRNRAGNYQAQYSNYYEFGIITTAMPDLATDLLDQRNGLWRYGNSKNMTSVNPDTVKVRLIALNVMNAPTDFQVQAGFNTASGITLSNDEFSVGGVNLLDSAPIISRGSFNAGDTVTPIYGRPVGNAVTGFSRTTKLSGTVNSSNVVQDNNTPVLEVPEPMSGSQTALFDFENNIIQVDGVTAFSAAGSAQGLISTGYKEVEFSLSYFMPDYQLNGRISITSTSVGSFSVANASTKYLMSIKFGNASGEDLVTPVALISSGEVPIFVDTNSLDIASPRIINLYGVAFILNIDTSGNASISLDRYAGDGIGTITHDWGTATIRLIALNPA